MFEFIYITDLHLYDRTPSSRTDNYFEAGKLKLRRMINYAQKNKINRIICGGDVFGTGGHARHLVWRAWSEFADIIDESGAGEDYIKNFAESYAKEIQPKLEKRNDPKTDKGRIDWYFNVGQHDLSAHSHETLKWMPLGVLGFLDNVHILPNNEPMTIGYINDDPVYLIGRWFDHEASQKPEFYTLKDFRSSADEKSYIILTSHGLLADRSKPFDHVLLSDLPESEADLFLASDYHPGWPTLQIGRTRYYAPGSFMRPAKTTRIPQGSMIAINSVGIVIKPFPLTTIDNPFRFDAPEPPNEHAIEIETFDLKSEIAQSRKGLNWADPIEQIRQISLKKEVTKEVRECTLELIEEAQGGNG